MRSLVTQLAAVAAAALLAGLATTAMAIAPKDHEKCYKIKDPAKIKGTVDLTTVFGLEAGCKVSGAKYFCTPAAKSNVTVTSNKVPVVPLPLYAPPAPVDRICYKVSCKTPPPPFPPNQNVTDQFGNRTLTNFKAAYVCTPAVQGPGFCGNGVIDAGEDCDGAALGSCTVGCRANCTCQCETACCYVEKQPPPGPDAECFQYIGNPAQVAAFGASCSLGGVGVPRSLFGPPLLNSTLPGACGISPVFGLPCMPGVNLDALPPDSTCP